MYCVDTNIIVDIMRGDTALAIKIDEMTSSGVNFLITPITLCELYRGAFLHINPDKKLQEVESVIANFQSLDFDLMIASLVKSNNLILVTRDKKHFKDFDIQVEVW